MVFVLNIEIVFLNLRSFKLFFFFIGSFDLYKVLQILGNSSNEHTCMWDVNLAARKPWPLTWCFSAADKWLSCLSGSKPLLWLKIALLWENRSSKSWQFSQTVTVTIFFQWWLILLFKKEHDCDFMCIKLHLESVRHFCSTLCHIQECIKCLVTLLQYEKAEEKWKVQKRVTGHNANVEN